MRDHLARAERPVAADAYTARSDREIARQLLAIRAQEDPQNTNSGSATSIAPGELCALTPEFGPMFAIMIVFESPMNESFNTWDRTRPRWCQRAAIGTGTSTRGRRRLFPTPGSASSRGTAGAET